MLLIASIARCDLNSNMCVVRSSHSLKYQQFSASTDYYKHSFFPHVINVMNVYTQSNQKYFSLCGIIKLVYNCFPWNLNVRVALVVRSSHSLKYQQFSASTDYYKHSFFPQTTSIWNTFRRKICQVACSYLQQ
jgi:hypothetical protein